MRFEWDSDKAISNFAKHGVAFDEASTVFGDLLATTVLDADHSIEEERWLTTGVSIHGRILIVWHANRSGAVRLIGARQATSYERKIYESGE